MFAHIFTPIEQAPQLRTLILRIPLSKLVPVREKTFLSTGLFFVTTTATHSSIKLQLFKGIKEGHCLQFVATGIDARLLLRPSLIYGILHQTNDTLSSGFFHLLIAVIQCFLKIMPGVDVQQRKRNPCRIKCLKRQVKHHNGIFSSWKQHDGIFKLRSYFANYEDRLSFQFL